MFDGIDTAVQPVYVAPLHLAAWVDRVRPHLDRMAEGSGGRYETVDIITAIAAGRMQLWVAVRGLDLLCAMITDIQQYPRLRAMRLIALSGRRPAVWRKLLSAIEQTAVADFGCSRMEAVHIPRFKTILPGYRTTHWISEKVLAP